MRLTVMIAALSLALAGCSMQDLTITDTAVKEFHDQFDAGRFEEIRDQAGPEIKEGSVDVAAFLGRKRSELGAVKSSSRTGFEGNVNNGVQTMSVTYSTVFETGTKTEKFLFRMTGRKPLLIGYEVN